MNTGNLGIIDLEQTGGDVTIVNTGPISQFVANDPIYVSGTSNFTSNGPGAGFYYWRTDNQFIGPVHYFTGS